MDVSGESENKAANSTQTSREYLHFFALYKHEKPENSLALLCSDLTAKNEELLRTFLTKRTASGFMSRLSEGSFCTLDFGLDNVNSVKTETELQQSVVCYYATLHQVDDDISSSSLSLEQLQLADCEDQEFTVCLLTSSEVNLEFFRPELQEFCNRLSPLLNSKAGDEKLNCGTYLEGWYDDAVRYLCRCVSLLGEDIALVFHLASMNRLLFISGEDETLKSDIRRFLNSCRLSELISGISSNDLDFQPMAEKNEPTNRNGHPKLVLNKDKTYTFSDKDCDDYCVDWARVIMGGNRLDPMFIKSVIENFKLTTVQSMNTFKRLVTDAEVNHYALYRAFLFLKNSKQKEVLLENAKMYDGIVSNASALDVIKVLEHFDLK